MSSYQKLQRDQRKSDTLMSSLSGSSSQTQQAFAPTIAQLCNLDGKSVLITGGTGSFGRSFVNLVTQWFRPARLIVFSRDELKQSEMRERWSQPCLRYFIGDIRDVERLEMAMRGIDYVI